MVECENNHQKWTNTVDYFKEKGHTFSTKLPEKRTKEDKESSTDPADPLHDAKFTSSVGGQKRFGTYSVEGLKYFAGLQKTLKANAALHAKPIAEFETKFLEKLKVADEVGDDGKPTKNKKGKKRKTPGDGGGKKRTKVVISLDSDDEEEQAAEENEDSDGDETTLGENP